MNAYVEVARFAATGSPSDLDQVRIQVERDGGMREEDALLLIKAVEGAKGERLEELERDVDRLEDEVSDLRQEARDLKCNVDRITKERDELKARLAEAGAA